MKTKILLLAVLTAAIVYSCSSERDEEVQAPVSKKIDLEPLKTNNKVGTSKVGDSIDPRDYTLSSPGTGFDPTDPNDPNDPNDPELIPPGDIRPPKGGK